MEQNLSKIYVLTDDQSRIIRCEGGYTIGNITDFTGWVQIDEGTGDKYNLCQSHYFDGGLYTADGIPRYALADGVPVLRSEEEIEADRTINGLMQSAISIPCTNEWSNSAIVCNREDYPIITLSGDILASSQANNLIAVLPYGLTPREKVLYSGAGYAASGECIAFECGVNPDGTVVLEGGNISKAHITVSFKADQSPAGNSMNPCRLI